MTLGVSEVACLPAEIVLVASNMLLGREFSYIYDREANVVHYDYGPPRSREPREYGENDQSHLEGDPVDFQGIWGENPTSVGS